jgi:hypothetical protein
LITAEFAHAGGATGWLEAVKTTSGSAGFSPYWYCAKTGRESVKAIPVMMSVINFFIPSF